MKFMKQFNESIDRGLAKNVFDHIRNLLICTFLLAVGTTEYREHTSRVFGFFNSEYSGTGVIGISILLIFLNFYDGIRKIFRTKFHIIFSILFTVIYVFISIRLVEMAWNYRVPY